MEWFEAVLLGLIQGLTEFLPVSSSGHLQLANEILGTDLNPESNLTFSLTLHAATVLSTIVILWAEIWKLLKGIFSRTFTAEQAYVLKIVISMIPVGIVGLFFKDQVESLFGSITVVGAALLMTALLLFFSDYASRPGRKSMFPENTYRNGISYWQAFVVGLGQALAVIPGLSRSGTTISTGLICGVRREVMAQFSFLMVLVPILGETFLELIGGEFGASSVGALALVLGFLSAFVSGLFACKVMIALVRKAKLSWFAVYCLIAAAAIFIFA